MSLPSRDRQHLLPGDHDSDLDDGEPRPPPRSSRVGNLDRNALAVVFGTLIACGSLAVWWSSRSSADSPLSVDNTVSGIASQIKNSMNLSSDPCDNFYEYACGGWMRTTSLPADKDTYARSFTTIQDRNVEVLHEIVQGAGADSDDRIGILWQSCMNEAEIESQGMDPLLAQIREIRSIASLPDLLAHLGAMERMHGGFFFNVAVEVDSKDTSKYVATVHQAGLTMGDRFRYVAPETNRTADLHHHFRQLQALTGLELSQSGVDLDAAIGNVVQFEVRIAEFTKPYEELRQPLATYNLRSVRRCSDDSGLDFNTYLRNMGFSSLTDSSMVNVDNPDFLTRMGQLLQATPLPVVKDAVLLRTAVSVSDLLPGRVRDEHFAFFSTTLRGIQQQPPRYKQCIEVIDRMLGDELGQRFLKQVHLSDDQKALAASIVDTIIKEFQTSLHSVSWMDEATQNAAISKLHKVKVLVGYPKTWTNYDALQLTAGKFADNVLAACEFSMNEMIARLGRPVDPYRFSMTVPTVNAYYEPTLNSINFPAGILQLPFFSSDESVPVALNYGGIGSVIGHELVHAFDDEGRQYDGDGVLNPWWPDEVAKRFKRRSKCLGKQYASIDFNDGFHIKPELTMGENIADNGGVSAAFKAFLKTEGANPDKEFLPGINNKQLFYIAMAQNWCQVQTKEKLINQLTTDPHSPSLARVHVPLMNSPEFAEEFRCAPNSKLNPVEKCIIW